MLIVHSTLSPCRATAVQQLFLEGDLEPLHPMCSPVIMDTFQCAAALRSRINLLQSRAH